MEQNKKKKGPPSRYTEEITMSITPSVRFFLEEESNGRGVSMGAVAREWMDMGRKHQIECLDKNKQV